MNMNLNKYLPSGYTSWFALYKEAKKLFRPGVEYIEWVECKALGRLNSGHLPIEPIAYSVRYLEQQTLAELIELREIETFNKKELEILYYGMQTLSCYQHGDEAIEAVYKKVRTLLTDERKKLRRG